MDPRTHEVGDIDITVALNFEQHTTVHLPRKRDCAMLYKVRLDLRNTLPHIQLLVLPVATKSVTLRLFTLYCRITPIHIQQHKIGPCHFEEFTNHSYP